MNRSKVWIKKAPGGGNRKGAGDVTSGAAGLTDLIIDHASPARKCEFHESFIVIWGLV